MISSREIIQTKVKKCISCRMSSVPLAMMLYWFCNLLPKLQTHILLFVHPQILHLQIQVYEYREPPGIWKSQMLCYAHSHTHASVFMYLIFAIAPASRTGVFPVALLSSNGPLLGLSRPSLQVSPSIRCEQRMRIQSTNFTGNHLSNQIERAKVDVPNKSLGRICT